MMLYIHVGRVSMPYPILSRFHIHGLIYLALNQSTICSPTKQVVTKHHLYRIILFGLYYSYITLHNYPTVQYNTYIQRVPWNHAYKQVDRHKYQYGDYSI
jgi:hypothetical protein